MQKFEGNLNLNKYQERFDDKNAGLGENEKSRIC